MVHLDMLLENFADIRVPVEVDLGTCRICVSDLLALRPGTELTFESAGREGFDVLVGNVRIGSGEVMDLDNQLVMRLEELNVRTAPAPVHREGSGVNDD